jgi:nitroreductase
MKRAVRTFADQEIPDGIMRKILNAGRRAQSSKNRQPWRFIAIRQPETLKKLAQLGANAGHLEGAALCVAILTPDPAQRWSIMFDAGQAAAYMQLAAWEMGIGSCLATIYEPDAGRDLLRFPEDLYLNVALSFGYPADPKVLTQSPKSGGRRPFQKTIYFELWNGS